MLNNPSPTSGRARPNLWIRFRQRVRAETVLYAFIFTAGLIFFFIQLTSWAIPQLTLLQEFAPWHGIVLHSRLVEEPLDGGGSQYRPEVLLEYDVRGTTYRVWTFDYKTLYLKQGFIAEREKAQALLDFFKDGKEVACWYRVDNPKEVIVYWPASLWGWFFLFFFFALVALGLIGLCQTFRLKTISPERKLAEAMAPAPSSLQSFFAADKPSAWPCVPDIRLINESPGTQLSFRLPLGNQPVFPLVGSTLFCLAWNAVAWGVMFHSFLNPPEGWTEQVIGIVLRVSFCAVGVILLVRVIQQLLLAFGTGPTLLEISDHPIYPGRRYRVLLHQAGVLRFHELNVDVVCEELARFRQGTDTTTNRKDVFRQNLFSRKDFETTANMPLHEEFFIQLPIGAMHSFRMENNEITWKFELVAKIAGWSELRRECPIIVRPTTWNDSIQEGVGL